MKSQDFTTAFTVDQTPEEAFAAINNVRGWWTGKPGIEGSTAKLGDEFTYRQAWRCSLKLPVLPVHHRKRC